jgi:uncharacterized protein (TIGR00369 family)
VGTHAQLYNAQLTQFTVAQLRELLRSIPFNSHLDLRVIRAHSDGVTIGCQVQPQFLNANGVLHGGVTATLADVAAGISLTRHLGRARSVTTVEMKINYLRPVTSGKVTARCRLVQVGARLAIASVEVRDEQQRRAAVALVTYMILEAPQ